MNQTKHLSKNNDNIDHFLTYADNFAIGYFKKQVSASIIRVL